MKHPLAALAIVLRKELIDGLRDRRSLLSVVAPLAIFPIMIFVMMSQESERIEEARQITVPVVGAEHAQELVTWLDQQAGIEIEQGPDEPREQVLAGDLDFAVVFPEDFGERFASSRPAKVEIFVKHTRGSSGRAAFRVGDLIRNYGRRIADQRLLVRGISPDVVRPIDIDTLRLETQQQRAANILIFIPFILVMGMFAGGLQIAIDSTAGERERGSLEPLLIVPVSRMSIIGGKWLAATAFSLVSAVLAAAMMLVSLELAPTGAVGLRFELDANVMGIVMLIAFPLAFPVTALQMGVATMARSYKEAQSYVGFLMLLPTLPLVLTMGSGIDEVGWRVFVPVFGQYVLIKDALGGDALNIVHLAITTSLAVALAVGCLWITSRLFRRERIVFGR